MFQKLKELQKHLREYHSKEDEFYQTCEKCNKRFSKSYMAEHMKSHYDAFKCNVCNKNFSCGSNLRKHIKKHKPGYKPVRQRWSIKSMKCDQCDKVLRGVHTLKVSHLSYTYIYMCVC